MTRRPFSLHAIAFLIAALTVVDVSAEPSSSQVKIFVSKEGNCTVLSKELPCTEVGPRLRDLLVPYDQTVVVSGSPYSPYKMVGAALQSLQRAGYIKIQFPNKSSHHDSSTDAIESVNQPTETIASYSPASMVEVRKLDDLPNGLREILMRGKYGGSGEGPEGRCCVFLVGGVSQTSAIVAYELFGYVPTYQASAFVQGKAGWVKVGEWNIGPASSLVELKDLTSRSPDFR
jgi:hypothetical protein